MNSDFPLGMSEENSLFFLTKNKVCLFVKCSCIRQVFMAVAAGQQVVK